MQHVEERAQVAAKQRVLEDALWHIARLRPETLLRPLYGLFWGYRHRARMSVRWVPKKGGSLVGFRERKSRYVTDMTSCEVLPPRISDLLQPLRTLVDSLEMQGRLPQIEVAVGEESVVLVFRVLVPPGAGDAERLRQFAVRYGVQLWLQPEGPDSARPFWPPDAPDLYYTLPEYGLRIAFGPTDFTQVNHAVNRLLVGRALSLLDPRPGERITDFFCGWAISRCRSQAAVPRCWGWKAAQGWLPARNRTPEPTASPAAAGSRLRIFSTPRHAPVCRRATRRCSIRRGKERSSW